MEPVSESISKNPSADVPLFWQGAGKILSRRKSSGRFIEELFYFLFFFSLSFSFFYVGSSETAEYQWRGEGEESRASISIKEGIYWGADYFVFLLSFLVLMDD